MWWAVATWRAVAAWRKDLSLTLLPDLPSWTDPAQVFLTRSVLLAGHVNEPALIGWPRAVYWPRAACRYPTVYPKFPTCPKPTIGRHRAPDEHRECLFGQGWQPHRAAPGQPNARQGVLDVIRQHAWAASRFALDDQHHVKTSS